MSRPRAIAYYDAPGFAKNDPGVAPYRMVVSLRIAYHYGRTLPTVDKLIHDFGMSRATAHRWRRAIKDALGLP